MLRDKKLSRSNWLAFIMTSSFLLGYFGCYVSIRKKIFPFAYVGASAGLRDVIRRVVSSTGGHKENKENKEKEWFDIAFSTGSVFNRPASSRWFYPPAENLSDIREFNRRIYFPRSRFSKAFDGISIKSHSLLEYPNYPPVSVIEYEVDGYDRKAFVYGAIDSCSVGNSRKKSVLFLIPGSGSNQSLGAFRNNGKNYHYGIKNVAKSNNLDFLVLIKQNEDFLAFTSKDRSRKLSYDFIVSYQYQNGGNYSTSYMVDALAVQKLLKKCYKNTVFAGLSQGGLANLITSLYSNPTISLVSSGYSLMSRNVEWSGPLQIQMVTGDGYMAKLFDEEYIINKIEKSTTKFLFTWGLREVGTYGVEAQSEFTANFFKGLKNVNYDIGDYGHIFPVRPINLFLKSNL